MSGEVVKSKRTALSWDQELKPAVKDLERFLEQNLAKNSVSNLDIFMLCLGFGFSNGAKRPIPPRKSDAVRLAYIKEPQMAIMKSIALAEAKDYMVLLNEDAIFDIVEQYAAGGLMLLSKEMQSQLNFGNWLTEFLFKQAKARSEQLQN